MKNRLTKYTGASICVLFSIILMSESSRVFGTQQHSDAHHAGVNVLDFGADPSCSRDSLIAFRRAIASIPSWKPDRPQHAGLLRVPRGCYKLSGTLIIDKRIILIGEGGSRQPATLLRFTKGGIRIARSTSLDKKGGPQTVIQDLAIVSDDNNPAVGILAESTVKLYRIRVARFGSHCVWLDGTDHTQDGQGGNVNVWTIVDSELAKCGGNGLHVQGRDSNGGTAIALDSNSNAGSNIYESSFLGNTYIGGHLEGSSRNLTHIGGTNRSVFIGVYAETNGRSTAMHPATIVGGTLTASIRPVPRKPTPAIVDGRNTAGFTVRNRWVRNAAKMSFLPSSPDGGDIATIKGKSDAYEHLIDSHHGWIRFLLYQGALEQAPIQVSGNNARWGQNTVIPGGLLWLSNRRLEGRGVKAKWVEYLRNIPVALGPFPGRKWINGDRIMFEAPHEHGYMGATWTPDGWRRFGKLE